MSGISSGAVATTPASTLARRAHLLLACVAAAGLLLRLVLTIVHPDPEPDSPELLERLVRYVSYFTTQSNVAVLLASVAVLRGADLQTRWHRALRLASLIGITVTGIVYVTILAGASTHTGLSAVANALLHYACPPLAVVIWLVAGPWPRLTLADLRRMLIWPVLWIAYTLIRGAITGWYPYGFIDVGLHGYGGVAVSVAGILVFAVLLASRTARSTGGAPGPLRRWPHERRDRPLHGGHRPGGS